MCKLNYDRTLSLAVYYMLSFAHCAWSFVDHSSICGYYNSGANADMENEN